MQKYKEILSSPRFQMLAVAAIIHGLSIYRDTADLTNAIITAAIELLTAVTLVGTVDKFSQASMAKAANTTVSIPSKVSQVTASTKQAVNRSKKK